jgi:DNA modification methylase
LAPLSIEYVQPGDLKPFGRNARLHSRKQIRQIADSIVTFGFTNPILIDHENMILGGHGRVAAAALLALANVPCVRIETMTREQKRAYVLADNKLALNAGWDEELLAEELKGLLEIELDFDVGVTGFSIPEIDGLIEGLAPEEPGDPAKDLLPAIPKGPSVARCGDLWQLGPHRLICGSALEPQSYLALMASERAEMVFTDPPYNVPISGHVGGSGAIKHREFIMASGEMTSNEFTAFLQKGFENLAAHSIDGSIHFVCMDWRHMSELTAAAKPVLGDPKNLCVWVKDNGGMGTFYRSRHELIFAFKNGSAPHLNNFELGQHGRYRTNVWQYRGVNTLKTGRLDELSLHPTVKPVAMIADAIKDVSGRKGIVLDPFGGSGSTLIAAHKTGRRGYLVELDPIYVDCIICRWQAYAKDDAVLATSGEIFDDVSKRRKAQSAAICVDRVGNVAEPSTDTVTRQRPSSRQPGSPAVEPLVESAGGSSRKSTTHGGLRDGH